MAFLFQLNHMPSFVMKLHCGFLFGQIGVMSAQQYANMIESHES